MEHPGVKAGEIMGSVRALSLSNSQKECLQASLETWVPVAMKTRLLGIHSTFLEL